MEAGPTLVTGAAGFIGRALCARQPGFIGVTRADADLRDARATRALFERVRPSRVIHLAAVTGGVAFHAEHDADVHAANTAIDANVIDASCAVGVTRFVALLSTCAYPDGLDGATEDDLHRGDPFPGSGGMGLAKRALERQCRMASANGRAYTTMTPVTVYGPGDRCDENGHVIPALLAKAIDARSTGEPLQVWGTGEAVRQFMYIDDIVTILLDEIARPDGPSSMIVAADDGLTIREVAMTISAIAGVTPPPAFTGGHEGQRVKRVRSTVFAERHPSFAFTSFDEGLRRTMRSMAGHDH